MITLPFNHFKRWINSGLIGSVALAFWFVHLNPTPVFSQTPSQINYQGRLTDSNGSPRNGNVKMEFRIYNSLTAGTLLWSEIQPSVSVSNGLVSTALGSITPLSSTAFDTPDTYLEVIVNDETLSPRQKFLSAPYALNSQKISGKSLSDLVTKDAQGKVGLGTTNPEYILHTRAPLDSNSNFVGLKISRNVGNITSAVGSGEFITFGYGDNSDTDRIRLGHFLKADGGPQTRDFVIQNGDGSTSFLNLNLDTGNLGLGNINPSKKLDIGISQSAAFVSGSNPNLGVAARLYNTNTADTAKSVGLELVTERTIGNSQISRISSIAESPSQSSMAFEIEDGDALSEKMRISPQGITLQGPVSVSNGQPAASFTARVLSATPATIYDIQTVRFDNLGEVDTAADKYVATLGGLYLITGTWNTGNIWQDCLATQRIYKNETQVSATIMDRQSSALRDNIGGGFGHLEFLSPGDEITIRGRLSCADGIESVHTVVNIVKIQ